MVQAQNCTTGYCPETIFVHHKAGDISPIEADITYEVTEVILGADTTCWIGRNLGATALPDSSQDYTLATVGWYWQFNRKQGYYWDGSQRVPNVFNWLSELSENSEWLAENDPCTLLLGSNWSIPTATDFANLISAFGIDAENENAYVEGVYMLSDGGMLLSAGLDFEEHSYIWTADEVDADIGTCMRFAETSIRSQNGQKQSARSVRCVRSY